MHAPRAPYPLRLFCEYCLDARTALGAGDTAPDLPRGAHPSAQSDTHKNHNLCQHFE